MLILLKLGQALLQSGADLMYYKVGQVLLQKGAAFLYYKPGQVELQRRTGITNLGNFYYKKGQVLQSGATFITKWGRYYKAGQLSLHSGAGIAKCGSYYEVGQYIAQLDSQLLVSSDPFTIPYLLKPIPLLDSPRVLGEISTEKNGKVLPYKMVKQTIP